MPRRRAKTASFALLLAAMSACAPTPSVGRDAGPEGGIDPADPLAPCVALQAMDAPRTIADAVARIDALPHPVSIACFVASLPRPLSIVATSSALSAQPAMGARSPRVFILTSQLVMSVVPAGSGAHLLEFGQWVEATRTIKGELAFPVTEMLAPDAPFTRVRDGAAGLTSCGLCHRGETEHPSTPGAYLSVAYRPELGTEVPVWAIASERSACDARSEPERCEILRALLDFGEVRQGAFRDDVPTFLIE